MNDWISVKDRLPEKGDHALLFGLREHTEEKSIWIGRFFDVNVTRDGNTWREEQFWDSEGGYDIYEVTHWMPLPREPAE